jgi:isopropylmalate/homocitrate/citramalate synthase
MMQQQMMNRQLLLQMAQQVAPATVEDLQELVEISRTAEPQGLDFAQVVTRIRESTPFAGIVQLLPKDRAELYALLAVLVAVLDLILSQRPNKVEVVTPDQVEQIIERVIENQQQTEQPATPPTTTEPECDQP